jgi:hypothetical protein
MNGNGAVWKQSTDRAETDKSVLFKHLDGKTLFTRMLRLYAAMHREMKVTLQPEDKQGKFASQSKRRKRNSDSEDSSSVSKKEAPVKSRSIPV